MLQSGASTQRCVTLAMDLATFNVVQEPDIWTNILERIVKFNMLETARALINDISEIRLLWVNPVMAPAWNLILQAPFKQSKEAIFVYVNTLKLHKLHRLLLLDSSDVVSCVNALEMLWSCPILEDIDLDALEKYVLNHDFPYLAALLLPFVRDAKRSSLIQVTFRLILFMEIIFYINFLVAELEKFRSFADLSKRVERKLSNVPILRTYQTPYLL